METLSSSIKHIKLYEASLLLLLLIGLIFRLVLTSNGNFIFNMDNARDMVDIREMVELGKVRLIGPTTGIEGVYTGPGWYYLLVIPYLLTSGDPYAEVLLMIGLWVCGGIVLVRFLESKNIFGGILMILTWSFAPVLVLATSYAFNPNPAIFLSPLLFYILARYLRTEKMYFLYLAWWIAGMYFNLEIAVALCIPFVISAVMILVIKKRNDFFKNLIVGVGLLTLSLIPQIVFELRHGFFMLNSLFSHLISGNETVNYLQKDTSLIKTYLSVTKGVMFNSGILAFFWGILLMNYLIIDGLCNKNKIAIALGLLIFIPFLLHLILPIQVMPWHLSLLVGGIVISLGLIMSSSNISKKIRLLFFLFVISIAGLNIKHELGTISTKYISDPSAFVNQLKIVDKIYSIANGKDFRVYTYIPSVYDFQYQYIFWWYGQKKYGYVPTDYAYAPNVPPYIAGKKELKTTDNPENSNKLFLIIENSNSKYQELWMNNFSNNLLVEKILVGPLELEVRNDLPQNK